MATEVSLRKISSGLITFYSTYSDASDNAEEYDVISIYADLDEQLILKNLVDIYIDPGTVINYSGAEPTIYDKDVAVCNITGGGIIKNSYSGTSKVECIAVYNSGSRVNIECLSIEGTGDNSSSVGGACVNVEAAERFSLKCKSVSNNYNTAIIISDCNDYFINIQEVESGKPNTPNAGAPVISIDGSGSVYINSLTCTGYGSCLKHSGGNLAATIYNINTLLPANETPPTAEPAVIVEEGNSPPELVLYFNEINNYNSNAGDAVKVTGGNATLIGNNIYCVNGLSLDLTDDIQSAYIKSDNIISLTKGINIDNENDPIVIKANYIEGSNGNDGVVRSATGSNYVLRNAKIKCTDTSADSVCIYLPDGDENDQSIEIENLILVTGNTTSGDTIKRIGSNIINIKNLGLFVNKEINESIINLQIGTGTGTGENFKYIVSSDVN